MKKLCCWLPIFASFSFIIILKIARKQLELKKKLKVTFAGEPGLDMGGLTKEWFLLLIRQIFQPEYGALGLDSYVDAESPPVLWFTQMNKQQFLL